MKTYNTTTGKTIAIPTMLESSKGDQYQVNHKVWESGDKKRVYISVNIGGKVDCGFVDLATGAIGLKSSPAWIAQYIKSDIVVN